MTAAPDATSLFAFVQFEFGFLLGPADGRYLVRDTAGADPRLVVVLRTLGAPQRRLLGGRRAKQVTEAGPEPVPTSRATLIDPGPFDADPAAAEWLARLKGDGEALAARRDEGLRSLNGIIRAHRAAAADVHARDVSLEQALVCRVGYGRGEQVADGRFAAGLELPLQPRKQRRDERIAPQEQLAAILGGRTPRLVSAELVLRARGDLDAGHPREAALEARVALEATVAELESSAAGAALDELRELRATIGEAANAALRGQPPAELSEAVERAVTLMERALRRYRADAVDRDFEGA